MKKLAGIILSSVLLFSGCSSMPSTNSIAENNMPPDLVDYIKQYPQYLEEYLGSYTGSVGLTATSQIFVSSFDFKGKNDELIVHARYIILPLGGGQGKPDLVGYTIYDVKEKTTFSYSKKINNENTPIIPSEQYKPGDKKI